jgi:flagellar basal body-associated protein FliL
MATNRERLARKCTVKRGRSLVNDELQARLKQIKNILRKATEECSQEELNILRESPEMVEEIERRAVKQALAKNRIKEVVFLWFFEYFRKLSYVITLVLCC